MKQYKVTKRVAPLPELMNAAFDPEREPFCQERDYAAIDSYVWDGQYAPEARAYMAWDDEGLYVLLCAKEESVVVKAVEFNGEVYRDSCLECFLAPFQDDPRYFNFEVNAGGVALIGFGSDRKSRYRLAEMPEGLNIRASRHEGGWWAVAYRIPFALIARHFDGRTPKAGDVMRGNFYKCEETKRAHFGTWNPIVWPKPDFHRPECFGEMTLEPVAKR